MRAATVITAAALLALTGCSSQGPTKKLSANVSAWRAGDAVVVMVADVRSGAQGAATDYSKLVMRAGVIAAGAQNNKLKVSFGRQALLVDMAALKLELERTPGVSNVREIIVPPR